MSAGTFARYARCYDLLYRDKDYAAEARFVDGLLRASGVRPPGPFLDIGAGTGVHARAMTALGWRVTGVDLSAEMVALARTRTAPELGIEYLTGAAAEFDLGRRFPAIGSLFHVASYQVAPGELARMLANVERHLEPGGIFLFDFWHGPGVRADPPAVRTRQVGAEGIRVTRLCTPRHVADECLVEVRYDVRLEHLAVGGAEERFTETHRLRYYFMPELVTQLEAAGLAVELTRAGLSEAALDERSWYGLVVARKRQRP